MDIGRVFAKASGGHSEVQPLWLRATGLRPLILEDGGLLWLTLFGKDFGFQEDAKQYSFLEWIGNAGHSFEAEVTHRYFPTALQIVEHDYETRQAEGVWKTIHALAAGTTVLSKAPLWDAQAELYGCCDYIIRSDVFYGTFPNVAPSNPEPLHYLIADAKFSNLGGAEKKLDRRLYEVQLALYSRMLGTITGVVPSAAYLICRDDPDRPLRISIPDDICAQLPDDIERLKSKYQFIKKHGAHLLPWRDEIVACNFGNTDKDAPWHDARKIIARDLMPGKPLEWLPGVGKVLATRLKAAGYPHIDHLLSIDIEDLSLASIPGIGNKTEARLKAVLRAHQTGKPSFVPHGVIPGIGHQDYFLDFEFASAVNIDWGTEWPPLGQERLFMIGMGFMDGSKWVYRQYHAASLSEEAERAMLEQFVATLHSLHIFDPKHRARLWHWSQAEVSQAARAADRHGIDCLRCLPLFDLQKIVKDHNITVPGAYGFGLKEFANNLQNCAPAYKIAWPKGGLDEGLSAMVAAFEMYARQGPIENTEEYHLLSSYLEVDVRALERVFAYLHANAESSANTTFPTRTGGWYAAALNSSIFVVDQGRRCAANTSGRE